MIGTDDSSNELIMCQALENWGFHKCIHAEGNHHGLPHWRRPLKSANPNIPLPSKEIAEDYRQSIELYTFLYIGSCDQLAALL